MIHNDEAKAIPSDDSLLVKAAVLVVLHTNTHTHTQTTMPDYRV